MLPLPSNPSAAECWQLASIAADGPLLRQVLDTFGGMVLSVQPNDAKPPKRRETATTGQPLPAVERSNPPGFRDGFQRRQASATPDNRTLGNRAKPARPSKVQHRQLSIPLHAPASKSSAMAKRRN